ncbi:hypothetical protein bcgnr5412_59360 [Bacillus cereus]
MLTVVNPHFPDATPNKSNLNLLALVALGLTTIYTAILATQLMSTKHKVDYLYYKEHFQKNNKGNNN